MVSVTITEPDALSVKVFGITYEPPEHFKPLRRASFGYLMDHIYDRLQQPFTVELVESDGSKQTGTIDLANTTEPCELPNNALER